MDYTLYNSLLAVSVTTSSFVSGFLLTLSYCAVPAILNTPNLTERSILTLWRRNFSYGFHFGPPLALCSGLCSLASAYMAYTHDGRLESDSAVTSVQLDKGAVYTQLVAGLFMMGLLPFTVFFIHPTNMVLLAKESRLANARDRDNGGHAKGAGLEDKESVAESRRLIKRWAALNYIRAMLPLAGAAIGWSTW